MHKLSLFSGKQLWIICHIHHSSEEVGKKDEINKNGGDYFFAVQLFHKWPNLEPMQVAFYLAGEITQVIDSIPWVRCASGNV